MPNKLASDTNRNLTVSCKNSGKLSLAKSSMLLVKNVSTSKQLIMVEDKLKLIFNIASERV
jgi:hypothetical protein